MILYLEDIGCDGQKDSLTNSNVIKYKYFFALKYIYVHAYASPTLM